MRSNKQKAHVLLFFVALIYGANYAIAKVVLDPGLLGANGFILLRIAIGAFLFILCFGMPTTIDRSDWLLLIFCSVTGIAANQLLFFNGLARTSAIHASLIMICTPLMVLILSSFHYNTTSGLNYRPLKKAQWLGCLMGFTAAAYIIRLSSVNTHGIASVEGDLMVMVNALFFAFFLRTSPVLIRKYGSFELMKWLFLIGIFLCLPFGIEEFINASWKTFEQEHWWSLVFVLVFTTFLAYAFNAKALEWSHPGLVGNYIYLQPFIAVMISVWLGKGNLSPDLMICGSCIMVGLYIAEKK